MDRRGFLAAILASSAPPAIVKAGSLMGINPQLLAPEWEIFQSFAASRINTGRICNSWFLQGNFLLIDTEPYRVVTAYFPVGGEHLIKRQVYDSKGLRVASGERFL